jgi:hypothetical protein
MTELQWHVFRISSSFLKLPNSHVICSSAYSVLQIDQYSVEGN